MKYLIPRLSTQLVVAVYALNTVENRKPLWDFISRAMQHMQKLVLIGGDYNAILSAEDRFQGSIVHAAEVEDFQACIEANDLKEIKAIGPQFTWTNN